MKAVWIFLVIGVSISIYTTVGVFVGAMTDKIAEEAGSDEPDIWAWVAAIFWPMAIWVIFPFWVLVIKIPDWAEANKKKKVDPVREALRLDDE